MVEHLVEVPTILSFLEQTVDIPVLRVGFSCWRSTRFSPRTEFVFFCEADRSHSSSRPWISGGLQGFPPWTRFGHADCGADR